jgi:flavin reductase (DIM6/NTAB) family NADH-FMN oxidoreductase RutF
MAEPPSSGVAAVGSGATGEPLDPRRYREILGHFATGVTVVTSLAGDPAQYAELELTDAGPGPHPWGTTVSAFTSVSLDPPLVLVSIGRDRQIHAILARTRRFAVNILGEESQALSDCFSGAPSTLPRTAFCGAPHRPGVTGMPILEDAIAYMECETDRTIDGGDHTLYVGRVVQAGVAREQDLPLLYFRGRYLRIERATALELLGKPEA